MPYEGEANSADEQQQGKIKVVCHGCGARYQVRDSKVRGRRFRATCKRCGGLIVARCTNAFTVLPEQAGGGTPGIQPTQTLPQGDLQQDDEACWYVVIAGKPHGPLTPLQVRQSFSARRINERSYFWRAGDPEWRRLSEIDEFRDLFADGATSFYRTPRPAAEPAEATDSGFGEEEATAIDDFRGTRPTQAAGPKGLRQNEAVFSDPRDDYEEPGSFDPGGYEGGTEGEPEDGETRLRRAGEEPEDQETRLRPRGLLARVQPGLAPQPSYPPLPQVPRRMAILPLPTGVPRRPELVSPEKPAQPAVAAPAAAPAAVALPAAAGGTAAPLPAPTIAGPVRPLAVPTAAFVGPPAPGPQPGPTVPAASSLVGPGATAAAVASGAGATLPHLAPPPAEPFVTPRPEPGLEPPHAAPPPGGAAPLPRVATVPLGSRPGSEPLLVAASAAATRPVPPSPGFWTTGKIAAAAAIAGGLAVAGTVVLAVALVRPRGRAVARVVEATVQPVSAVKERVAGPTPKASSRPAATSEVSKAFEPLVATAPGEKPARKAAEKAPRPKARKVAQKESTAPGKRSKALPPELAEADALLAAAATSKLGSKSSKKAAAGAPKVDVDDILAAGSGAERKPARKGSGKKPPAANADDILAAGSQRPDPSALPQRPPRAQIEQAMRAVLPRVKACFQKYQQAGKVDVVMTLRGDGGHDQQVVGAFAGTPTGACVLQAVARARLPRFSGPPATLTWPFKLP